MVECVQMVETRQMPIPATLAPELSPDYIRPIDYIRPLAGGLTLSLGYLSLWLLWVAPLVEARYWMNPLGVATFMATMGSTILLSAFLHHQAWLYRLRKYGVEAFEVYHDLELPLEEAFELCLASSAQLRDSKIEKCDDTNKAVEVRVSGNFWITVDRLVEISVQKVTEDKTRMKVKSVIKLTPVRTFLFQAVWGPKWQPLLFRSDFSKNKKIMCEILSFVQNVPNWDHKYLPGNSFDHHLGACLTGSESAA